MSIYRNIALLFMGLLSPAYGFSQNSSPTQVTELAEGLYQIQIDAGAWTTNMVAFVGEDGLLLVDSRNFFRGIRPIFSIRMRMWITRGEMQLSANTL